MHETTTTASHAPRRAGYVVAFAALLCLALVAAIAIPSAGASRAKVLGKTKHTPDPACPNNCKAIGRVTGFPTVADGVKHPFRVERDGKLVAWAADLGKPGKADKNGFGSLFGNKRFGKQATGRIAVLKHQDKLKYKLLRQSATVGLNQAFGRKQIFTLNRPLTVRKGDIVAFTSPTWTPNFQENLSVKDNKWRASRTRDNCTPRGGANPSPKQIHRFARESHPQQKEGSTHNYECLYTGGRLLYWAYFVPNKK